MISQDKLLEDGNLYAFLLGSSGPLNNKTRVATSIGIIAAGKLLLFDIGPGAYRNADIMRLPVAHLSAIFLTHFHSDHIGDLGEANVMSWANGRENPLEIYGPKGVEQVVNGFIDAYALDTGYRIAHHGKEIMDPEAGKPIPKTITIPDPNARTLCYEHNGLEIYAFIVEHPPISPAVGYRLEYGDKIIVITGDTIKTDNLVNHCQDADLLFCESISYAMLNNLVAGAKRFKYHRYAKILTDIQDYHMNPETAASVASQANVKKLVLTHITPPLLNEATEKVFLKGVSDIYKGPVILGKDLMKFKLKPKKNSKA